MLIDILSATNDRDSCHEDRASLPRGFSQVPVADHFSGSLGRLKIPSARRYENKHTNSVKYGQEHISNHASYISQPEGRCFTARLYKLVVASILVLCSILPLSIFANGGLIRTKGVHNSPKKFAFQDNDQISVVLSDVDVNRILVKDDKISNINGPVGLYTAKTDGSGAAFITVNSHLPFTLYVSTVNGRSLSLFIRPKATVGKTVILKSGSANAATKHWEENSAYQTLMTTLMKGMINHKAPDGYAYVAILHPKATDFFGVASITPIAMFNGAHLLGVVSIIQNKTKKPITLKPSYFYHHSIRSVALSKQAIKPLSTGLLYEIVGRDT